MVKYIFILNLGGLFSKYNCYLFYNVSTIASVSIDIYLVWFLIQVGGKFMETYDVDYNIKLKTICLFIFIFTTLVPAWDLNIVKTKYQRSLIPDSCKSMKNSDNSSDLNNFIMMSMFMIVFEQIGIFAISLFVLRIFSTINSLSNSFVQGEGS